MKHIVRLFAVMLLFISCKSDIPVKHLGSLVTEVVGGGRIWSLDWSPNGQFIACGNATGLLRIYRSDNLELARILTGFTSTINGIDWSPDSKSIVASGSHDDPRVIIWDLENKSRIVLEDHTRQVRTVQWSPKGSHFASTSHDGTIKIWTPEGEFVKQFTGASFGCVGIDWLNEDKLAASCWDNTIRIYSISDKESLVIENGNHRRKAVLSVDWHPDGKILATGDYGNEEYPIHSVKLWTNEGQLIKNMTSHQMEIRDLSWNRQGNLLATGGETVRLWNEEGELLKIFDSNNSPVWSLDWNPEGTRIASGHNDGKIRIWNTEGVEVKLLDGHSTGIDSYSFNKDSTFLALGFSNGELRFYDTKTLTSQTFKIHKRGINHITWSHSQQQLAMSSNDGTGSIWEIKNNKLSNRGIIPSQKGFMNTISWSPNDTEIATGADNAKVMVWDSSGKFKYAIPTDEQRVIGIKWENQKPIAIQTEQLESNPSLNVFLNINKNKLALIPLNKNRFALVDSLGNLFKGDKKDFVRMIGNGNGFTTLED